MLISGSRSAKFDQERLLSVYNRWPEYFEDALKIPCELDKTPEYYKTVFLCGMGGSATSCDILHDLMHRFGSIPSTVIRGQNIPSCVDKHSLVIVNSVSGNTEEALSVMEQATDKKAEVICISSGGRLKEKSESKGAKNITIPNLCLPRASLPYLIVPGLRLVDALLKKSLKEQVLSIPSNLSKVIDNISVEVPEEFNSAKKIASFINNCCLVFCFTSPLFISAGVRFKNSLNENAKIHGITASILEASHNEVVPFSFINSSCIPRVLFLKWINDQVTVNDRFNKVKTFFRDTGQFFMEIENCDDSLINGILSSICILDYSTIYLAINRNINPSATPAIDLLKK